MEWSGSENTTGTITGKDLSFDSLYNTYEHGGLPPGRSEILAKRRYAPHCDRRRRTTFILWPTRRADIFLAPRWWNTKKNVVKYHRLLAGLPADPPPPPPSPRKNTSSNTEAQPDDRRLKTKKALILETAREIKVTAMDARRDRSVAPPAPAEHGEAGKAGSDYIADVLQDAGQR